jgi:ABC-type branched-subunit amino acid transport system substrate-binding protein
VLKTYDDGTSDAQTIVANDRKAEGQVFGFLSVLSTTNQILAPLANKQKIPLVYTDLSANTGKTLKYAFPAWPYLTTEAAILPSYIRYDLKGLNEKIGVSYDDDATAIAAEGVFLTDAANEGLNVVGEESVQTNQSSCTTEDTALQSEGAQIVVQINGPISGGCMLSGATSVGFSPTWTGLGSLVESSALPEIAGAAANGVTAITGFTSLETPAGKSFVSLVNKFLPGTSYNSNSLAFYGSAELLIHGLKLAGKNLTRASFVTAMDTIKNWSSGYQSPATFSATNRSGPQSVAVAQVVNGNWVTTDPTWRTTFKP